MLFDGPWVGMAIVVLMGIVLFGIYAVGLKYTYARGTGDAPGQNYVGEGTSRTS
jgi:hypothetical protein